MKAAQANVEGRIWVYANVSHTCVYQWHQNNEVTQGLLETDHPTRVLFFGIILAPTAST